MDFLECKYSECNRQAVRQGLCNAHYMKEYRKRRRSQLNIQFNEWYARNRAKARAAARRRNQEIKREVFDHYGGKCNCCGESMIEFLTIDHIDNDGAAHRRILGYSGRGTAFYRWIKRNGYPGNLRVLCYNCNSSLGHFGYCPHG